MKSCVGNTAFFDVHVFITSTFKIYVQLPGRIGYRLLQPTTWVISGIEKVWILWITFYKEDPAFKGSNCPLLSPFRVISNALSYDLKADALSTMLLDETKICHQFNRSI